MHDVMIEASVVGCGAWSVLCSCTRVSFLLFPRCVKGVAFYSARLRLPRLLGALKELSLLEMPVTLQAEGHEL